MNCELEERIRGYRKISFVGGGGKTTLIFRSALLLRAQGKKVIVTTTTHMFRPAMAGTDGFVLPEGFVWVEEENEETVAETLEKGKSILLGLPDPKSEKKIIGVSDDFLKKVQQLCDVVLVEADGSRRRPVKIPRPWEPVIPEDTDLTVAVAGMTAWGQRIQDCAYEPEDMSRFLKKETGGTMETEDICRIVACEDGLRKGARGEYLVILNQADTEERRTAAEEIRRKLEDRNISCIITHRKESVALILLAAGLSSRFEGDKILARLADGRTMLEHAMDRGEALDVQERILVYRHRDILQNSRPGWKYVRNDHPEWGISRSLQLGIAAAESVDGWMFSVCDQPKLTAEYMNRLIRFWKGTDADIVSASYGGYPGNPKIFSVRLRRELEELSGDSGGREILQRNRECVLFLDAPTETELLDVDTRNDLEKL